MYKARKPRRSVAGFLITFVICNLSFVIFAGAAPVQKFPPVSGEIYGQASPGVKSITINKRPVAFDAKNNFHAQVNLKAGEKYVILNINYDSFRLIKKYLIIRKPETKTFTVFVPKEKIEKAAKLILPEEKVSVAEKKARKKVKTAKSKEKRAKVKPVKPAAKKTMTYEYLYVWEFSQGRLLAVKKSDGKYSAEVYIPVSKQWISLTGISKQKLEEIINEPLPAPPKNKKKQDIIKR